jgi:SAM-dependent methyltransferase
MRNRLVERTTAGLRLRMRRWRSVPYERDPSAYWEVRHTLQGANLGGVGCQGASQDANQRDYYAKWFEIGRVLAVAGPARAQSLLDAGCGTGWFAARAAELGWSVDAVDFSKRAVRTALELHGNVASWHIGNLDAFSPGHPCHVVMCIDVLFHVTNEEVWLRTVRNLASLVQGNGWLIIQEHLVDSSQGAEDASADGHVRFRLLETYLDALQGWRLVEHRCYPLPSEATWKDLLVFRRQDSQGLVFETPESARS